MVLVATISVDKALEAWRMGSDIILLTVEMIRTARSRGQIMPPNHSPDMAECRI